MADNVNHPSHYESSCSIECIEAMRMAFGPRVVLDFCRCNAFKYLWRHKNKNGMEDLEKAKWYVTEGRRILREAKAIHGQDRDDFNESFESISKVLNNRIYIFKKEIKED